MYGYKSEPCSAAWSPLKCGLLELATGDPQPRAISLPSLSRMSSALCFVDMKKSRLLYVFIGG